MSEHFDVAVLGLGPGGEVAADRLLKAGKNVVVFERELIGGECAYCCLLYTSDAADE